MQLIVVVAQKGHVIAGQLRGDLNLIKGSRLKHSWGQDTHLHQRILRAGAEIFKGLKALIPHPVTQLLAGAVVNGSEPSMGQHPKERDPPTRGTAPWLGMEQTSVAVSASDRTPATVALVMEQLRLG
jgi:hypothetical protein